MPVEEVLPNRLVQDVALLLCLELLLPLSDGEPNDKGLAVVWLPPPDRIRSREPPGFKFRLFDTWPLLLTRSIVGLLEPLLLMLLLLRFAMLSLCFQFFV